MPPIPTPGRGDDSRGDRVIRSSARSTTRSRPRPPRRDRRNVRAYRSAAERRLRNFRNRTALAVAFTGLALLLWGVPEGEGQTAQDTVVAADTIRAGRPAVTRQAREAAAPDTTADVSTAVGEATGTLRELARSAYRLLPKLGVAAGLLVIVALLARGARTLLRRASGSWQRAQAVSALVSVVLWLLAIGAALAILAGDARALLGSVGLVGLALSWALQAPIESFSGWLLNSFRGYYRVGDRIAVGDVLGDVYAIDVLTTTVWEAGGERKAAGAAQPTGALVTFPNSEVLRANITNYTRDFPFVWDEVVTGISNESDLPLAIEAIRDVARETIGVAMKEPAALYADLLRRERES